MTSELGDDVSRKHEAVVPVSSAGQRLDKAMARCFPDLSRSRLKALILNGDVFMNDIVIKDPSCKVREGDVLVAVIPSPVDDYPKPENIPLDIVYEDNDLLVINKQAGLVVHPGAGHHDGTLVNALLYHCGNSLSGIGGVKRPGIVHRLDKDTTGLMIVAKHDKAHQGLAGQLSDRTLSRRYHALAWRVPMPVKGVVDAPLDRHSTNRQRMSVRPPGRGREARTHYNAIDSFGAAACLLDCTLETGRTHQIRVHMAHIGHPLIGDPLYGLPAQESTALLRKSGADEQLMAYVDNFPRQALHAHEIAFIHPVSEEHMRFQAPWPKDLELLKECLNTIS